VIVGLVWGLPPGDWATWFGSGAVGLSFVFLAYGTVRQARESARQAYLDESTQARLVGATLTIDYAGDQTVFGIDGINASSLSIRRIAGFVLTGDTIEDWHRVDEPDVHPPGQFHLTPLRVEGRFPIARMVLVFQDDAGTVWRKYDDRNKAGRITKLKRDQPLLHGLTSMRQLKKLWGDRPSGGDLDEEGHLDTTGTTPLS
jgi:hypothetical protein